MCLCVCSRNDNKCDYSGLGLNLDNEVIPKSTAQAAPTPTAICKPKG